MTRIDFLRFMSGRHDPSSQLSSDASREYSFCLLLKRKLLPCG